MTLLMIRPIHFAYNAQTAVNNTFQKKSTQPDISEKALAEFDHFVGVLQHHGIHVMVIQDTEEPYTPDSIFPNNWVSFHRDGTVVLYPMFAENRRLERKKPVLDVLSQYFVIHEIVDYTNYEVSNRFLEGTGSFVLDRENKVAYASLSSRTDQTLFEMFCQRMGYKPVAFQSFDAMGMPIYHTNVMMCVADQYAIVNLGSVSGEGREHLVAELARTGKEIVSISLEQMNRFAGNMLQVENQYGRRYLVLSSQAYSALDDLQLAQLEAFNPLVHAPLGTIEKNGGGSARCMMAEIFLPPKRVSN